VCVSVHVHVCMYVCMLLRLLLLLRGSSLVGTQLLHPSLEISLCVMHDKGVCV